MSTRIETDVAHVLPAAPARRTAGFAGALAVLLAVLTGVLGALLVREALIAAGFVAGTSWIAQLSSALDGQGPAPAAFLTGLGLLLLGLVLLFAALSRRGRAGLALRTPTGAYLDRRSLDSLVRARALAAPGVVSVSSRGNARRVRLEVHSTTADVGPAVREAVLGDFDALARPPTLRVDVRPAAGSVPAQVQG